MAEATVVSLLNWERKGGRAGRSGMVVVVEEEEEEEEELIWVVDWVVDWLNWVLKEELSWVRGGGAR